MVGASLVPCPVLDFFAFHFLRSITAKAVNQAKSRGFTKIKMYVHDALVSLLCGVLEATLSSLLRVISTI